MDFTLKTYQTLLEALIKQGFCFQSFGEYIELSEAISRAKRVTKPTPTHKGESLPLNSQYLLGQRAAQENEKTTTNKCIILRHDVDKLPENSLILAQIQHKLGIKGSYYFGQYLKVKK